MLIYMVCIHRLCAYTNLYKAGHVPLLMRNCNFVYQIRWSCSDF